MSENTLKAISWTLIHSLWEGLVLAVLAGLVILFTRKRSSLIRYNLLCLFFFIFLVSSAFTLIYELDKSGGQDELLVLQVEPGGGAVVGFNGIPMRFEMAAGAMGFHKVVDFLNNNAFLIVLLWFIVFSFKSVGVLKDLGNIYRVRNYRLQSPPDQWKSRLTELQELLGIRVKTGLFESGLVGVPGVTGFINPIILVPVGMLSHMPAEQVEAILLHELAHIRRKDYLVNFIQCFAEMIFFFNPGLIWLSTLIREERENCCDDLAISVMKNKSRFVNALVAFQEYNLRLNPLSLGFGHQKKPLLNRARRILHNHNKSLNKLEKAFLSVCLLVTGVLMFAFSANEKEVSGLSSGEKASLIFSDTLVSLFDRKLKPLDVIEGTVLRSEGNKEPSYLFKHRDVLYQVQGNVRLLKVNGKLIPEGRKNNYLPLVQSLMKGLNQPEDGLAITMAADGGIERMKPGRPTYLNSGIIHDGASVHYFKEGMKAEVRDQKVVGLSIDGKPVPEAEFGKYLSSISWMMGDLNKLLKTSEEHKQAKIEEDQKILDDLKKQNLKSLGEQSGLPSLSARLDALTYERHASVSANAKTPATASAATSVEPTVYNQYTNDKAMSGTYTKPYESKYKEYGVPAGKDHEAIEVGGPGKSKRSSATLSETTITDTRGNITKKTGYASEQIPKGLDVAKLNAEVINELYHEQLVKDVIDLSYKLDAFELVVNGKKQDADLHQKLKDKYIKTPKSAVYYNYTDSAR